MKIQVLSDIHIDFKTEEVPNVDKYIDTSVDNSKTILVLAGDIGNLYKYDQLYTFLDKLSQFYKYLIYVPGNHEYYMVKCQNYRRKGFEELKNFLNKLESNIQNLYVLDRAYITINDIYFVGATLWSKLIKPLPHFVRINEMDTVKYSLMHREDINYIKKMVHFCKKNNKQLVVITHYPPFIHEHLKDSGNKDLYSNDIDFIHEDNMKLWICGHVHKKIDKIINGTRIVGNPHGKDGHDVVENYDKNLMIEI